METFVGKALILVFESEEFDRDGKPKLIRKTIKNISKDATDDEIRNVGLELSNLYELTLHEVLVDHDYQLV